MPIDNSEDDKKAAADLSQGSDDTDIIPDAGEEIAKIDAHLDGKATIKGHHEASTNLRGTEHFEEETHPGLLHKLFGFRKTKRQRSEEFVENKKDSKDTFLQLGGGIAIGLIVTIGIIALLARKYSHRVSPTTTTAPTQAAHLTIDEVRQTTNETNGFEVFFRNDGDKLATLTNLQVELTDVTVSDPPVKKDPRNAESPMDSTAYNAVLVDSETRVVAIPTHTKIDANDSDWLVVQLAFAERPPHAGFAWEMKTKAAITATYNGDKLVKSKPFDFNLLALRPATYGKLDEIQKRTKAPAISHAATSN